MGIHISCINLQLHAAITTANSETTDLILVPALLDILIANPDPWLDETLHQVWGLDTQEVGHLLCLCVCEGVVCVCVCVCVCLVTARSSDSHVAITSVTEREDLRRKGSGCTGGVRDGCPLFSRALLHFDVAKVQDTRDGLEHGHLLLLRKAQSQHRFLHTDSHTHIYTHDVMCKGIIHACIEVSTTPNKPGLYSKDVQPVLINYYTRAQGGIKRVLCWLYRVREVVYLILCLLGREKREIFCLDGGEKRKKEFGT